MTKQVKIWYITKFNSTSSIPISKIRKAIKDGVMSLKFNRMASFTKPCEIYYIYKDTQLIGQAFVKVENKLDPIEIRVGRAINRLRCRV